MSYWDHQSQDNCTEALKDPFGFNSCHKLLPLLPSHSMPLRASVPLVLSISPPYGQNVLKACLTLCFYSPKCNIKKASMTKAQIPKWNEWQLKLQSASQMVRRWDGEGWFLRIYCPEFVENSRSLAGDERILDAINKYYCIPVQRRSCARSGKPVCSCEALTLH